MMHVWAWKACPTCGHWYVITARQKDILRLVADGKTRKEIASELVVSESTVREQLRDINDRLGTVNAPHGDARGVVVDGSR